MKEIDIALNLAEEVFNKKIIQHRQNDKAGYLHYLNSLAILKAVKRNDVEYLEELLK